MSPRCEALRLEDVWVSYSGSGRPAIREVNLSLSSGESVLITGPNGAGKTTLLETCLGLLKPFRGEAFLFGVNTKSRRVAEVRKLCGYVPQNFMKPPEESYTVRQVISMGLAPLGSLRTELEARIDDISSLLGIGKLMEEPFGRLSGGQQQRVMIARALVRKPRLLLLDEPFSSMDLEMRSILAEVLRDYSAREDAAIVVVSHDEVPLNLDRVIRMNCGRVVG
ncbi:MAG: ATP-binding cassette domain-containing protein [Candidatus Korarchaeum sp.]